MCPLWVRAWSVLSLFLIIIHLYKVLNKYLLQFLAEWHISNVACGSSINNTLALSREGYVFSFEYSNADRGLFFCFFAFLTFLY